MRKNRTLGAPFMNRLHSLYLCLALAAFGPIIAVPQCRAAEAAPLDKSWLSDADASVWSAELPPLSDESQEAEHLDAIQVATAPSTIEPSAIEQPAIEPTQFMSPMLQSPAARQQVRRAQQSPRPALRSAGGTGLASIPYMIGDTGAGTCIGFSGLVDAMLAHPTLACGRLNIAEANTPLPTDRVYYSYRHFHNTSMVSAYQFGETLDIDRHLLAWENTFWDGTGSLELRVPIEQRLQSNIFSILAPSFGVVDPLVAPGDGRRTELGNVSAIFKLLLIEQQAFAMSTGLGVTLPTAQDVNYQLAVDGEVVFPNSPGLTADEAVAFQSVFANETVYLSPFMAWLYAPESRWFHQGFMQVEVAANPSHVTVDGDGATLFLQNGVPVGFYDYFTPVPVRAELHAQTLLRLNLGLGYVFAENPRADWFRQLTGLFEMHYTSTLEDAKLTDIPLTTQASAGTVPLQTITVGNQDNRVDILNAATGVSAQVGAWIVTNGFVAPVRQAPDRGFDFEYNLQVQRPF
jgi:hypothetical protein